eukprot:UN02734
MGVTGSTNLKTAESQTQETEEEKKKGLATPTILNEKTQLKDVKSAYAGSGLIDEEEEEGDMDIPYPLGEPNDDNIRCWMKINAGGEDLGKVTYEIKEDVVPKTAENFKQLCTMENGYGYKGVPFHRVIPNFMAQSGP